MKVFFRFVLLALILLVVALFSALTAMRLAIHGREGAVPDLVGKAPSEARRIAEASGFEMEVERQFYNASVPEGRILSQVPSAGSKIRRGWEIRVAESLGPQRITIPSVVGESSRAAEMNIRRRGLDVAAVAELAMPGASGDQILAQSPLPNASGVSAPKINLLAAAPVSAPVFVMPSFIGQALGGVELVLKDAGFHVGNITVAANVPSPEISSPPVPAAAPVQPSPGSVIVSQNPAPGARISAGSAVNLEVR